MVTTYFRNCVADAVWHTDAAIVLPAKYFLALSAAEPKEDGSGMQEPDPATGYARVEMTGLTAAVDGVVKNDITIVWPRILVEGGAMTHWALFDAATDGNLLMGGKLDSTKHLDVGTSITIDIGKLELRVVGA